MTRKRADCGRPAGNQNAAKGGSGGSSKGHDTQKSREKATTATNRAASASVKANNSGKEADHRAAAKAHVEAASANHDAGLHSGMGTFKDMHHQMSSKHAGKAKEHTDKANKRAAMGK